MQKRLCSEISATMAGSISEAEYDGEKYSLVVIPGLKTKVVVDQIKDINDKLHLDRLAYDFKSLGLFLRLAHYGVVGHVDLQIAVGKTLYSAVTICDDTVHTVHEFERASQKALDNMQAAYEYLEEDLEEDAIDTLQQVIFTAQKMQEDANKISQRCRNESEKLLEVQNATKSKDEEVSKKIKEANKNLSKQKSEHEINEKSAAEEEAAAVKSNIAIETASKNKDDVFKTKEEYIEERKQELLEKKLEQKTLIQPLQSELEKKLNQIHLSLKETLQQNENEYRESLIQNDNLMKTMLQENIETIKRQQKTILDDRQKSEDTSKADYEVMLQTKFKEIENKAKLERAEFALQYDKEYQLKLTIIEKEYEDKVAMYESQYKKKVEGNNRFLKKQIDEYESDFNSQEHRFKQEHDRILTEINASCRSEQQNIDQKYGSLPKLSENDIQDTIKRLMKVCSDQVKENEEHYELHLQQIENDFSNTEKNLTKEFQNLRDSLAEQDKTEYEELQTLLSKPIEEPTEASPGVFKRAKKFFIGNQEDTSARDRKQAEAKAMQNQVQLAKECYEKNKTLRHDNLTKASEDLSSKQCFNKKEKIRKTEEANNERSENNNRAKSERDSKIEAVKRQKSMYDERMQSLSNSNEKKSQALQAANSKLSQDIQYAKNKQIAAKLDAEKSIEDKNEVAKNEKLDNFKKALDAKEKAIVIMKNGHIEAKIAALKLEAQNEANILKSQIAERERIKWESETKNMEQKKVKADARVYAEKTKNNDKALVMKRQNDKEAVEKADKDESKLKSEYEMKVKKIEQTIQNEEMQIKERFRKKHENMEKKFDELKQLEEYHRRQQKEHEKQRKEAKKNMAEAAQKIASFQDEVEVNKSSEYCLQQADRALSEIQDVMLNTSNFWRETESICKSVTEHGFTQKVTNINSRAESSRKALWRSPTFKKQALTYYGKWVALKHVCINTEKQLSSAQEDIHKYLRESPNAEDAKRLVREIADELGGHLAIEDVPSDKK